MLLFLEQITMMKIQVIVNNQVSRVSHLLYSILKSLIHSVTKIPSEGMKWILLNWKELKLHEPFQPHTNDCIFNKEKHYIFSKQENVDNRKWNTVTAHISVFKLGCGLVTDARYSDLSFRIFLINSTINQPSDGSKFEKHVSWGTCKWSYHSICDFRSPFHM